MTSTTYAASGFSEPFTTPQKRLSTVSTASAATSAEKPDAALRAATLSFSPPFTRQSSDDPSLSASPSKTNGTALIAARAIGTGNSSPKASAQNPVDHRRSLSRNSSFDLLATPVHGGSLKAAQLSVSRSPSAGSVSRAKSYTELSPPSYRVERSYSEDAVSSYTPVDGSLIAAKLSAARRDSAKGSLAPAVLTSSRNDTSPPSLLAAGLAVSRSTTPGSMPNTTQQPERDQEPDILPAVGTLSEAKKRYLQQLDAGDDRTDSPVRGRRSLEGPTRSKIVGTFLDTPPTSTVNISPLSAAKLAVQHSGRNAGSAGPGPKVPKPRQPSPIKQEYKRDPTPSPAPAPEARSTAAPPPNKPVVMKKPVIHSIKITETPLPSTSQGPPPPAIPKKPALQNIKITETPLPSASPSSPPALTRKPNIQNIKITQTPLQSTIPSSPKPAPKPTALKKLTSQETGTPPPQPIKPLPRKTRPPPRTVKSSASDVSSGSLISPKTITPIALPLPPRTTLATASASPRSTPDINNEKAAPPPPLPRGTKPPPESPKPIRSPTSNEPTKPAETVPTRRDPRLMGFNTIKLPPPAASQTVVEPVKQSPVKPRTSLSEPAKQSMSPVQAADVRAAPESPIKKPKPDLPPQRTFVDSIVLRQPPSFYSVKERNVSTSSVSLLPPPPAPAPYNYRRPSASRSAQALRPNLTGPESTRTSPRPIPTWRDDLPYDFSPAEYIRPSHTGDSVHHAILASSLASSRAGSPVKSNPIPLPPRPSPGFRTTMRSPDKSQDRDGSPQKKSHILGKKHPNKHNEGARKRWREFVTEKERKRYEGLWAANRGLYLTEKMFENRPDAKGKNLHQEAVCAVVVKDLWSRSRLPVDILEQVWELVDRGPRPKWWLTREEFIMGLWLIDQSLKGRKLPGKVQDGTWESVRRMGVVLKPYEELGLKEKKVKKR